MDRAERRRGGAARLRGQLGATGQGRQMCLCVRVGLRGREHAAGERHAGEAYVGWVDAGAVSVSGPECGDVRSAVVPRARDG